MSTSPIKIYQHLPTMVSECFWGAFDLHLWRVFMWLFGHGDVTVMSNIIPSPLYKIEKYPPNGHPNWIDPVRNQGFCGFLNFGRREFEATRADLHIWLAVSLVHWNHETTHFVRWKAMIQASTSCIVPVGLLGQLLASTQPACSKIRLVAGHNCCVSGMLSAGWISPHFKNGLDFLFSGVTVW